MNAETRRFGNPKTDEERASRHQGLYGTADLPPRGTGLSIDGTSSSIVSPVIVGIVGIGIGLVLLAYLSLRK